MKNRKSSAKIDQVALLWIGKSPTILQGAVDSSYGRTCVHIEVTSGVGYELKVSVIQDGKTVSSRTSISHDAHLDWTVLNVLRDVRSFKLCFAIYEYDAATLAFWAAFFDFTGIEFTLVATEKAPITWKEWAFLCAATARIVTSEDLLSWWKSSFIFDAEYVDSDDPGTLAAHVKKQLMSLIAMERLGRPVKKGRDKPYVTFISYYFPPVQSVAMQRLDYWHNEIERISKSENFPVQARTITAVNSYLHPDTVTVIRDFGDLLPYEGEYKKLHKLLSGNKINTISLSWTQKIHNAIEKNPDAFSSDITVFSGNPFFYFDLGSVYRSRLLSRVVLDFRDPFALNPRIKYTSKQRAVLSELEKKYLRHADAVISVNKSCLDLVSRSKRVRYTEIANGYDERAVEAVSVDKTANNSRAQFIYAGTFYEDCSPENFLKALDAEAFEVHHYGLKQKIHDVVSELDTFSWKGRLQYSELLAKIKAADAGLIFTGGKKFEQTTKIFDYIAADLDIIIVTEGTPKSGEIYSMTKHLDRVYWVKNNPSSLKEFFADYQPRREQRPQRTDFSREEQTRKLIQLMLRH